MVARSHRAALDIDPGVESVARLDLALDDPAMVAEHRRLDLERVLDKHTRGRVAQLAGVADLAARLGIEGCVVEHDHRVVTRACDLDRAAVDIDRNHLHVFARELVVAVELGVAAGVVEALGKSELAGFAGALLLLVEQLVEACGVDRDAAFAAHVGGQVDRKAVGVVQLERGVAVELRPLRQCRERALQDLHAVRDRAEEAFLLLLQHVERALLGAPQFGIRVAHLGHERRHQRVEERLPRAELVAVPDRTPGNPAQHVAAAGVAGDHAVDDREGAGADVIGDHFQRRRCRVRIDGAGRLDRAPRRREQMDEQVDLVVRMHMLQHRGEALEAHAGVDARFRQRVHHPRFVAVELHEDVVPDLDVAVAVFVGRAGRTPGDLGTVVVEDLGARAARAGVTHHPEVVRGVARALVVADADDAVGRHADLLVPDRVGLVVFRIDGDPELLGRQREDGRQQLPGVADRILLEVVAKAEVAQHLEEGLVPRGVADVLEVVVLAAGADALLRRGGARVGALVEAEEDVLELVHPGVGEQQRRVVAGHDRARGDDRVTLLFEELQEGRADFGGFHRGGPVRCTNRNSTPRTRGV